jgi:hypothetical protein
MRGRPKWEPPYSNLLRSLVEWLAIYSTITAAEKLKMSIIGK